MAIVKVYIITYRRLANKTGCLPRWYPEEEDRVEVARNTSVLFGWACVIILYVIKTRFLFPAYDDTSARTRERSDLYKRSGL